MEFIFAHSSGNEVSTSLELRPNEDWDVAIERARKKCANELATNGMGPCNPGDLFYLYCESK